LPELLMPPAKAETANTVALLNWNPTSMPALPAETVPRLLMPPAKVEMPSTTMPSECAAILPLESLTIPPEKVTTVNAPMPLSPAESVPVLLMPPPGPAPPKTAASSRSMP
jgi:hypothetical protein